MKISVLLVITFSLVISLVGITSIVSVSLIDDSIREMTDHELPKQRAAFRMESSAEEASRAILGFTILEQDRDKQLFATHISDFKKIAAEYRQYGVMPEEDEIMHNLDQLVSELDSLGTEIISIQEEQSIKRDERASLIVDNILPMIGRLQSSLSLSDPSSGTQQRALFEMELALQEIRANTNSYLVTRDQDLKQRIDSNINNFDFWLGTIQNITVTSPLIDPADRTSYISTLERDFDTARLLTTEIIGLQDLQEEKLTAFSTLVRQIDNLLENRLQFSALTNIGEAQEKTVTTFTYTMLAIILVIIAALIFSMSISKKLFTQINYLRDAVQAVENGNLDVAVHATATNEISDLSRSFNAMVEKLKVVGAMQRDFLAVASHELRAPIHSILNQAALAVKGQIPNEKAMPAILEQARKLRRLSNDILDVTRIGSGQLKYYPQDEDINPLIVNSVGHIKDKWGLLDGKTSEVSIELKLELTKGLGLNCDKERIEQALINVLDNAFKFTKKGTISVETKTEVTVPQGLDNGNEKKLTGSGEAVVKILISDTGQGIDDEVRATMFEKFVSKDAREGVHQGIGLGLYITNAIILAHKGKIEGYNNEKGGATFVITLPLGGISN